MWPSVVFTLFSKTADKHFFPLCVYRNIEHFKKSFRLMCICSYEIWSVTHTKISLYLHIPYCCIIFLFFYELILKFLVLTNSIEGSSVRILCKPMVLPLDPILCQFEPLYVPMVKSTIIEFPVIRFLFTFLFIASA